MKLGLLLGVFLCFFCVSCQEDDQICEDSAACTSESFSIHKQSLEVAKDFKENRKISINKILEQIFQSVTEEELKFKAIYTFIILVLDYDESISAQEDITQNLVDGKGNSIVFAKLFDHFCSKAGLKSSVVLGVSKFGDSENPLVWGWNLIEFSGKKYLVDCALSSDEVDYFWFMSPPELFIFSHYPNEKFNQLLSVTWLKKKFDSCVKVFSGISNVESFSHEKKEIKLNYLYYVDFKVKTKEDYVVDVEIHSSKGYRSKLSKFYYTIEEYNSEFTISIAFPKKDTYYITFFTGKKGSEDLQKSLYYEIKNEVKFDDNAFPKRYDDYINLDYYYPRKGTIELLEKNVQIFKFRVLSPYYLSFGLKNVLTGEKLGDEFYDVISVSDDKETFYSLTVIFPEESYYSLIVYSSYSKFSTTGYASIEYKIKNYPKKFEEKSFPKKGKNFHYIDDYAPKNGLIEIEDQLYTFKIKISDDYTLLESVHEVDSVEEIPSHYTLINYNFEEQLYDVLVFFPKTEKRYQVDIFVDESFVKSKKLAITFKVDVKKKKGGLLGGIFGKKKKENEIVFPKAYTAFAEEKSQLISPLNSNLEKENVIFKMRNPNYIRLVIFKNLEKKDECYYVVDEKDGIFETEIEFEKCGTTFYVGTQSPHSLVVNYLLEYNFKE